MEFCVGKLTICQLCKFMATARPLDIKECEYADGIFFQDHKVISLGDALCLYDEDTGDVFAIGAVYKGRVWVLCTTKVEEHKVAFLKFCKDYIHVWQRQYTYMENWVWLGNDLHVKWLKWLGAVFDRKATINGQPFQHFYFQT